MSKKHGSRGSLLHQKELVEAFNQHVAAQGREIRRGSASAQTRPGKFRNSLSTSNLHALSALCAAARTSGRYDQSTVPNQTTYLRVPLQRAALNICWSCLYRQVLPQCTGMVLNTDLVLLEYAGPALI